MKRSYVFSFLLLISLIARKAKNNNAEEPAVAASNETPSVVAAAVTFPEASKRLLKEADVNNRSKDALELMGRTDNNRVVNFPIGGHDALRLVGKFVDVVITGVSHYTLRGEIKIAETISV